MDMSQTRRETASSRKLSKTRKDLKVLATAYTELEDDYAALEADYNELEAENKQLKAELEEAEAGDESEDD